MTIHDSRFTIHNSQFTIHNSRSKNIYIAQLKDRPMQFAEILKADGPTLARFIIDWASAQPAVDIQHDEDENEEAYAYIIHFHEDDDQQVAFRLYADGTGHVYIGYYNDKDDFIDTFRHLTYSELHALPPNFLKLLKKVLADEEGIRVPGKVLV